MTRPCCQCGTALVTYRGDKPASALSLCLPCWRAMTARALRIAALALKLGLVAHNVRAAR